MEEKRGSGRGSKRHSKMVDEGYWDCSVCTYKNSPEAYKCEMCDVRKGTSTRKPRINPQLAQQVAQQFAPPPTKKERSASDRKKDKSPELEGAMLNGTPRLKNVDRSKAKQFTVTCNNVTVVITDYPFKATPEVRSSDSHISSDASDTNSSTHLQDLHIDSPSGSNSAVANSSSTPTNT
ncbi:YY1-associated factor 2-like [Littorina saxatilis]|uniref:RanBP2-type domain-containing protein n=1 Tax=Littorina saxatilis TaxID=31220 RepID=A0AAN9GB27_9CAEN